MTRFWLWAYQRLDGWAYRCWLRAGADETDITREELVRRLVNGRPVDIQQPFVANQPTNNTAAGEVKWVGRAKFRYR